jgi:ABC-type uncharacterized transport system ATPase component
LISVTHAVGVSTAGMLPPSSGNILLNGRSVAHEPGAVQAARLGLCPQRNVLYDTLTVREHLALFAAIRGMPGMPLVILVGLECTHSSLFHHSAAVWLSPA